MSFSPRASPPSSGSRTTLIPPVVPGVKIRRVSDGVAARAVARAARERFRITGLLDWTGDGVYVVDPDGQILYLNRSFADALGVERRSLVGTSVLNLLPVGKTGPAARWILRALQGAKGRALQIRLKRGDGGWTPFEIVGRAVRRKDRDLLLCVARDVTERTRREALRLARARRASDTLKASETLFRSAFQGAPTGVLLSLPDLTLARVNPALVASLGGSEADLLGREVGELVHPEDRPEFERAVEDHRTGRLPVVDLTLRMLRRDGSAFRAVVHGVFVREVDGRPRSFLAQVNDVTSTQTVEEGLRTALREQTLLAREVHHRIRNNMQVLSSLIGLQAQRVDDPRAQEVLRETQDRIRCMALIHESLHASGRADQVDLGRYLGQIAENLFRLHGAEDRGLRLSTAMQPIPRPIRSAIPIGLIANELVTNCLKHAFPEGRSGRVDIVLERAPDDMIALVVRDDGIGLPDGYDRIDRGTLGMRIIGLLAQQVGATMQFDRSAGTTVRILFPAAAGAPE